jgi:hypothetical protein
MRNYERKFHLMKEIELKVKRILQGEEEIARSVY